MSKHELHIFNGRSAKPLTKTKAQRNSTSIYNIMERTLQSDIPNPFEEYGLIAHTLGGNQS